MSGAARRCAGRARRPDGPRAARSLERTQAGASKAASERASERESEGGDGREGEEAGRADGVGALRDAARRSRACAIRRPDLRRPDGTPAVPSARHQTATASLVCPAAPPLASAPSAPSGEGRQSRRRIWGQGLRSSSGGRGARAATGRDAGHDADAVTGSGACGRGRRVRRGHGGGRWWTRRR